MTVRRSKNYDRVQDREALIAHPDGLVELGPNAASALTDIWPVRSATRWPGP
jgi:hypothetical protein